MSFFAELKRRNVLRVAAAYAAVAWLLIQIAETTFPAFGLSEAALRVVIVVVSVGFIPTVIFAWAFELTSEGFKPDSQVDRTSPATRRMTKRLDRLLMVSLALCLGYFAIDKFVLSPQRQAEELATATDEARLEGRAQAIVEAYGDKSIAVLPFADLSPEGDQQYFSDGISEELLNLLAKVRDLRVISRSSSFALKDHGLSVPEVAKMLNVSYVLEGSVRKAGDRVRITTQLIEARSDTHLWAETYDRTLDDIFSIQDEISARVVSELKVRLLSVPPNSEATDLTAYDLYLRGRALFTESEPIDPQQAIDLFTQVSEIVPDYAPAYAGLALALISLSDRTLDLQQSRIEAAANRALGLDPGNSEALAALGRVQWFRRQVDEARATLEQAIENNPSNSLAYRWLGSTYINRDPVRYLSLVEKAYLIDPLFRGNFQMRVYALGRLGRRDDALDVARERYDQDPTNTFMVAMTEWIHLTSGRQDLALKSLYCAFRLNPDNVTYQGIVWRLLDMGEYDLADKWIDELERRQSKVNPDQRAVLAHLRGEPEEVERILSGARQRGVLTDQGYAFWILRLNRDFEAARQAYEQDFAQMRRDIMIFDPDIDWLPYLDYALILQRAGEPDRALLLIDQIQPFIEKQIADGVIIGSFLQLQLNLAELYALREDTESAVASLRQALKEGFTTFPYLDVAPQFDGIRKDPGFQAVYKAMKSELMIQRQRLAEEGMLLTPEQVLQLPDFSFNPFAK